MSHALPTAGDLKPADFNIYDVPELVRINRFLVDMIAIKNREREVRASTEFGAGDYAKYTSTKTGALVHMKVRTVNPKSLIGPKLNQDGTESTDVVRVSPSLCTKTTLADAIDAMKPKVVIPPPSAVASYEEDDEEEEGATPAEPAEVAAPIDPTADRPTMEGDAW